MDTRFAGTWQLVDSRLSDERGEPVRPYGPTPQGRVSYDAAGNMAVQLTPADRPTFDVEDPYLAPSHLVIAAFAAITTYFGTYTVDTERARIHHHIVAASHPNWVGRTLERGYRFDTRASRLTLIVDPYRVGRVVVAGELDWERIG